VLPSLWYPTNSDSRMLSRLIVCALVMGATAFKPPMPFGPKYGAPPQSKEAPKPCCPPSYFTFSQTTTASSVGGDGELLIEMIHAEGAYDAISEQIGVTLFEDFFNKTQRHLRFIDDYKEEVSYLIIKDGEDEVCLVGKTEGKFPEDCLPSDAVYVGGARIGDYALDVDNFYFASEDSTEHTLRTVQQEGCVPVSFVTRKFDPSTGAEVSLTTAEAYDFSLGICDRDEYFSPPTVCEQERALSEPTSEMLKLLRWKSILKF